MAPAPWTRRRVHGRRGAVTTTITVAALRDELALLAGDRPVFVRGADGLLYPAHARVEPAGLVVVAPCGVGRSTQDRLHEYDGV